MNRRDAFRVALAAAASAMFPRQATPVDEIADIFGVPAEMPPRPNLPTLLAHDPYYPTIDKITARLCRAMAEKVDADWRKLA